MGNLEALSKATISWIDKYAMRGTHISISAANSALKLNLTWHPHELCFMSEQLHNATCGLANCTAAQTEGSAIRYRMYDTGGNIFES